MSDDGMDEIVEEFLVESAENLDQLDRDLVALEREPGSRELLGSIFRAIHTIKGTTGFLGFGRLEKLAHVAENLLSKLRDGVLQPDADRTTALLEAVDAIRGLLALIESTGADEDDRDLSDLIARLTALQSEDAPPVAATEPVAPEPAPAPAPIVAAPPAVPVPVAAAAVVATRETADPEAAVHRETSLAAADRTIRVDVELLDVLMRQVGELVLARNQVNSYASNFSDTSLNRTVQRLSLIVSELQEGVMKTRMQPVEHLWSKVPRFVRDLASQFGKQVNLSFGGGETELDRSIMEAVKDPLTHLVRNAVDHGIESPETRVEAGKPAAGSLTLRAYHEGGQVVLEMTDDGGGIDPAGVAAKALERGLVTPDELDRMNEREVIDLIFRPGLSTAKVVSNVSGRGVGMDVVRTNIERIGGTVDLTSVKGQGTTMRVKIPLTLAIIPALLVGCRDARYAIPQVAVQELVRLEGDAIRTGIELIDDTMIYRLRGRLLPLVRLDRTLGHDAEALTERPAVDIAVVRADGEPFGLVVDAVHETQEIVVKPLSRQLKALTVYAGATILGDGDVALILDVSGLADAGRVREGQASVAALAEESSAGGRAGSQSLVLLRVGEDRRVAVPLTQVARLEEIDTANIEHAGSRQVIQYRGDLLPLVWLADLVGVMAVGPEPGQRLHVVVCGSGEHAVGLVAEEILDIVDEVVAVSDVGRVPGVVGTTVVQGLAADLLDVPAALSQIGMTFVDYDDMWAAEEEVGTGVA